MTKVKKLSKLDTPEINKTIREFIIKQMKHPHSHFCSYPALSVAIHRRHNVQADPATIRRRMEKLDSHHLWSRRSKKRK